MKKRLFFPILKQENLFYYCGFFLIIIATIIFSWFSNKSYIISLISLGGIISVFLFFEIFRFFSLKNRNALLIKFTQRFIVLRHNVLFYKKVELDKNNKIFIVHDYITKEDALLRHVGGAKNLIIDEIDKSNFQMRSFFIIGNSNLIQEECINYYSLWKPGLTQNNYNHFMKIMFHKELIVIDANFKNYKFLRQKFDCEDFIRSNYHCMKEKI